MCGMTREEDIIHAAKLGVDAIGLIFYPQSPRCVSLTQAKKLLRNVPLFVDVVAVLVNPSSLLVDEILNELPIGWLQFHGEESPEFCNQFKKPYIKAMQVSTAASIHKCCSDYPQASAILLDTPSESSYGGTGQTFDWGLIPGNLDKPFILSGGLDAANVNRAVNKGFPYAVDVCSGIEASYGIKDHEKMNQFVNALRGKNE
ncbi:N-(5'-phosphoribosyl)anthranilate isomerase [Legionella maceachernii]|uniref:N-(5'-phosphoribosyl)anthranilate isomerase n=2 Tax=Legionellaceae TaxID=444 RepID=A0A0W0WBW4_9GAMM|nr:N-(5'-phosphoribosyl)anthranilate isomerase [Legionella maceachernii]SJZ79254.1 phosphoribosylanthranilate isomerase [Legionella maceachernii]SUP02917.1 N-(5'-phosphoribosyl)anthranilate isomerase [Legionella maceachernii]